MYKRLWSLLLAVAMVLTMVPAAALLAGAQALPSVYRAAHTTGITVDGTKETQWLLSEAVTGTENAPKGSFGALWNASVLYLALDTGDASEAELSLNGSSLTVNLGSALTLGGDLASAAVVAKGSILEVSVPMEALDFALLDYEQTIPLGVTLKNTDGTADCDAALGFMGLTRNKTAMQLSNFGSGKAVLVSSNNGYEDVPGGIHIYDKYGQTNGQGRLYFFQTGLYPSNTVTRWVEFDFCADKMPVQSVPTAVDNAFSNFGFSFYMSTGSLTGAPVGIVNTAEGLYFQAGTKLSSFRTVPMGKNIQDTFHVAVAWTPDDILHLYVDGQHIAAFENTVVTTPSAYGNSCLYFTLWRRNSVATSADDDYDITLTNICSGTGGSASILDALTAEDFLGSNAGVQAVVSDLNLPAAVSNDQLGPVAIQWNSSDPNVISADGKVIRDVQDRSVTLTATVAGTQFSKSFRLTVPKQVVQAQLRGTAVTLDGQLTESLWYNEVPFAVTSGTGAPTGSLAVLWDKDGLYLGVKHTGAQDLELKLGDKSYTYNNLPAAGLEFSIGYEDLGIRPQDYNRILCAIEATLFNGGGSASLASAPIDLVLTGALAKDLGKGDKTFSNVSTALKDNYTKNFLLDHGQDMTLTQTLCFTDLPVCDGAITAQGSFKDRFYYFIYDNMDTTGAVDATYQTLMATIYRADTAGNLYLRVANGKTDNSAPAAVWLGKKLGDTFRLDTRWGADGSATVWVDGVQLARFENVTYRYGFSAGTGSYIDMRYQGSAADKTATYSIAKVALITATFDSIRDEITPKAVFGNVDPENITAYLTLPKTFASPYLGSVPLTWKISDETVIAPDGTVTRPAGKAGAAVQLQLCAFGSELWIADVFVPAVNQSNGATPAGITAAFSSEAITLDGQLTEKGWVLHNRIQDANGVKTGSFGVLWQSDALLLAVDRGSASSLSLKVGEKNIAVDLATGNVTVDGSIAAGALCAVNGSVAEIKLPFAVLGIPVNNYGISFPITVTAGSGSFAGQCAIGSVSRNAGHNSAHALTANVTSAPTYGGFIGAQATADGYRLYDLYNFLGDNPAGQRTYAIHMNNTLRPTLYDRSATTYLEFDFRADALPVTTPAAATGWDPSIPNYGFVWVMTDQYPADSQFANVVSCGIFNTQEGLMLAVAHSNGTAITPLDREVGDVIRIGTAWYPNGDAAVYIDGVQVTRVASAQRWLSNIGNGIVSFNTYRDRFRGAACRSDNMDISIDHLSLGKFYGDKLSDSITFDLIKGENTDPYAISSRLELPTTVSNSQLTQGQTVTWTSSDSSIIDPVTGQINQPDVGGKPVILTATLSDGDTVSLELFVKGILPGGTVMVARDDKDPAAGIGIALDTYRYTLDENNNSIIAVLPGVQPVNVVAIRDADAFARLNEDVLTLWVSDDNVTYSQIKDFKLFHKENTWYLYDFSANAKYVKVHCTHFDGKEADFTGVLAEMIEASYESCFGDGGSAFTQSVKYRLENNTPWAKRDDVYTVALQDLGITGSGSDIRVLLNGKLLYHYVENGNLMIRVPEIRGGSGVEVTVLSGNADAMDIANKEYTYEVSYGAREMMVNEGGYFISTLENGTMVGMCNDPEGQLYRSFSYNGGRTWTEPEAIEACTGWFGGHGGFIEDSHTGRLIYHGHFGSFNPGNIAESSMVVRFIYSDDGGVTWHRLTQLETDAHYILSYSDGLELSSYDGEGENVDFVLPLGSLYDDTGSMCTRVAYSTDAGSTWRTSDTKIIFHGDGEISGAESGLSESTILEREDGVLVLIARCQAEDSCNFARSYSYDKGITWTSPAEQTSVYTVNTQPMMYRYDDSALLLWSGNNILGGNSYQRTPLNVAVSRDGMETFVNIQDLYVKYSVQGLTRANRVQCTNPALRKYGEDTLVINWTHHGAGRIITTRVEDFTDYFYRTKGAWDSFENGSVKYEGWSTITGFTGITDSYRSDGSYAMELQGESSAARSIPYFQDGVISLNVYVRDGESANMTLELQATHSTEFGKGSPIAMSVEKGRISLLGSDADTGLTLKDGWNTLCFDLSLRENRASLSVNGSDKVDVPVNADIGNYITYVYVANGMGVCMYIDEFLAEDTVTERLPGEQPADSLMPGFGINLVLNETIDMNLIPAGGVALEGNVISLTYADGSTAQYSIAAVNGSPAVRHSFNADQMSETVTIQIFDAQGTPLTKELTISVRDYVAKLLSVTRNDTEKALMIRLLDYGALAQIYGAKTAGTTVQAADLANSIVDSDLRAFMNSYNMGTPETYDPALTPTGGTFSANLTLNESVDMNVYVDPGKMLDNEKIVVKLGDQVLTEGQYKQGVTVDGKISIRYSFNADRMNEELTVALADETSGDVRISLTMSVRKLAYVSMANYSSDTVLCATFAALLDYGALAQQYGGTNTDDLANRYVTADQRKLLSDYPWPAN